MFSAAYVDESYDLNIGVHILTASIVDLADAEEIRAILHTLRTGAGKLHWYQSDPPHRFHLAKVVGALDSKHVAVVGRGLPLRTERARRKCMEILLPELEHVGVDTVLFEARQARNDKQDRELIAACRRKRLLSARLQASFTPGGSEPLLWLPDIACGAVLTDQRGDSGYLEQFGETVRKLLIEAK